MPRRRGAARRADVGVHIVKKLERSRCLHCGGKYLKLGEVASVGMEPLVVQVDDVGGHYVEEIAVVADHHQGLLPPLQVLLQRFSKNEEKVERESKIHRLDLSRGHNVEEVAIVADHHQGLLPPLQVLLQRFC